MSAIYDQSSLVFLPSGYKDGKLYSQKPLSTSGELSFSRGSDIEATRVNANGYIEKAQVNLLLQSNSFDTTWTSLNTTETGGQAGYDGSNDAWRIDKSASDGRIYQTISLSGIQTMSIYAKAGTKNWLRVRCDVSSGQHANSYFDLSTGNMGGANFLVDRSMTSVGGGWYKCTMTWDNTTTLFRIYVADGDGDTSGTSGNIYIQDAQLNYGLVAQDYQETTTAAVVSGITDNMPRLNYDPANPTCPSLLLEPSRQNLFSNDTYYGGSDWSKTTAGAASAPVVTTNYAVSPEGVQNASRVYFNAVGTSSADRSGLVQNFAFTSGQTYTISGYAKSATGTNQVLQFRVAGAQVGGELTATNEWQRFSVTHTATTSTTDNFGIQLRGDNSANTSDLLLYGLQLELASYESSLIPTYGSSATRTEDQSSSNNLTSFGFGNSYTVLFDMDLEPAINNVVNFEFKTTTGTTSFTARNFSGNFRVYDNIGPVYPTGGVSSETNKWVMKVDGTNFALFGVSGGVAVKYPYGSLTPRNLGYLSIAASLSAVDINKFIIFPTALSDADCGTLIL